MKMSSLPLDAAEIFGGIGKAEEYEGLIPDENLIYCTYRL
jgi:hypothetical protein